jgi:hypothetical protein
MVLRSTVVSCRIDSRSVSLALACTIFDVTALSFDCRVDHDPVATFPIRQSTSEPTGCSWAGYRKGQLLGVREHRRLRTCDAQHFQGEARRQSMQFIGLPATGKPAAQTLIRKVVSWRPPHVPH